MQRRATKLIPGFRDLEYSEILSRLGFRKLAYRRVRGDMLELYKIVTAKYGTDANPDIPRGPGPKTTGNRHKIFEERMRLNHVRIPVH